MLTIAVCIFYLLTVPTVGTQKGSICMAMNTAWYFGSVVCYIALGVLEWRIRRVITFASLHHGFISLQGFYVNLTDLKDGINQTKRLGGRVVVMVNSTQVWHCTYHTPWFMNSLKEQGVLSYTTSIIFMMYVDATTMFQDGTCIEVSVKWFDPMFSLIIQLPSMVQNLKRWML